MTIAPARETVNPLPGESPELLIKEARRASRRRRLRVGATLIVVLVSAFTFLSFRGGSNTPVPHRALRPMRSPGLSTELAQRARVSCATDSDSAYPLPYRVIQRGAEVYAFFSSWTNGGKSQLGPVNCQYVVGRGPSTGTFGFSTSPTKRTPGLSAARPIVASTFSFGEAFHNPRTVSIVFDGEVSPLIRKVVVWANVSSSGAYSTLAPLQVVAVLHPNRSVNGGYLAAVLPTLARLSQSPDQIYLAGYGRRDNYLGESSCGVSESGLADVGIGSECTFSDTQFLGGSRPTH